MRSSAPWRAFRVMRRAGPGGQSARTGRLTTDHRLRGMASRMGALDRPLVVLSKRMGADQPGDFDEIYAESLV